MAADPALRAASAPPALRTEGLTVHYGAVRALDTVDLEVAPGALHAVLGANGAGKTTFLRAASGLHPPRSGRVLLFGEDVTGAPAEELVRRGLLHVPEGGGVLTELTVEENLRLGGLVRRGRAARAAALGEVYDLFEPLRERRTRSASSLSGGERQMLAIGRALMAGPRVILLDEPSLGLAPLITRRIMHLLQDLRSRTGLTVVLVEQNARTALRASDRAHVLDQGAVATEGPSADLLGDPRVRAAYLGL
ncbi:ABC transporter ATP-binding protein [Nocardiopsis suaedae]|uniref:ABC transporter ATP-binding protein n=1 Tax=Nocardiopsis suaedae TaxID=3018444 RepID=A0ABT4TI88_9ACTN|nr:ABC transporter ATP-binding protein [Nocardiopsis suaedae]MDA2804404.1 ABC transporter ATP-binding protein [Nocardiopsis suaedae]